MCFFNFIYQNNGPLYPSTNLSNVSSNKESAKIINCESPTIAISKNETPGGQMLISANINHLAKCDCGMNHCNKAVCNQTVIDNNCINSNNRHFLNQCYNCNKKANDKVCNCCCHFHSPHTIIVADRNTINSTATEQHGNGDCSESTMKNVLRTGGIDLNVKKISTTTTDVFSGEKNFMICHCSTSNSSVSNELSNSIVGKDFCNNCLKLKKNHFTTKSIPTTKMSEEGRNRLGLWGTHGDMDVPGNLSGLDRLMKKRYNKGLAFTSEERQLLSIRGLLPHVVKNQDEQVKHCLLLLKRLENDLDKYMYLNGLSERNERLFYKVLSSDITNLMPIVYTPTVGLACQKFSLVQLYNPKGLFITKYDKGYIYDILRNWPETDIRAICVTDGERILGLGDLGANGMGIPIGKLSLYTALAGIKPHQCLPITLDVGTNNQSFLDDELYIGVRERRIVGQEYDDFVDEFMEAVVKRFGQNCLIQFEDFANDKAFRFLEKYRDHYCTFNDDIQGTASVALAGILASLRLTNTKLKDNLILFQGAGEAALGIANLCVSAMIMEGLSKEEAKTRVWLVDSKGLIVRDRPKGGLNEHKLHFAHDHEPIDTLVDAVNILKPTILIGAAAIGGAFTKEIIEKMAELNEKPVIFALSNPTIKAECTAEQAYTWSKGSAIFASGSPFDPFEYEGKVYTPGQGNNAYIFPGVALGVICAGMLRIPEECFLMSAERLAKLCSDEQLEKGCLYPPLSEITNCSVEIAEQIMQYAYDKDLATLRPEPKDKIAFIRSQMYDTNYPPAIPKFHL
ncbi:NADP-dependent malic enzyme isoform X2 [Condylostylus longicornis]|uniref:NADP-dependent malic enzyme isoform X2 n=1 Tax=Condylostylus longicornis TaxID=2530218 RepID=UPI00244DE37E|nr:NADP-dependent malic enzyme isoform X2 [Condylostylus longicornis]